MNYSHRMRQRDVNHPFKAAIVLQNVDKYAFNKRCYAILLFSEAITESWFCK
jgi:hypothetical protein